MESLPVFGTRNYVAICATFAAINTCIIYFFLTQQSDAFHSEDAALENAQVVFLMISTLGFLFIVPFRHAEKPIHIAISLLCFSFILRELDLEDLNVSTLIKLLGSGQGRVLLLAFLWALLAFYGYGAIKNKIRYLRTFFSSPLFAVLLIAFLMLIASAVLDKKIFNIGQSRFFEELAETNAYMLISLPVVCLAGDWISCKANVLSLKFLSFMKRFPPVERRNTK
ncbi:MAG: hypothetical protein ACJA2Q_001727 [Pseudohongiellaceae bacterium]